MFIAFQFSLLGDALIALKNNSSLMRFLGIAGLFSWIAVAVYNVTQDSFAIPNIWVNFGILTGMTAFALESNPSHTSSVEPPGTAAQAINLSNQEIR